MKISFINVNQGDSVILEWEIEKQKHIGIIDSNKEGFVNNPTVEYLKKIQFDFVDFVILSHPHFDHYSGLKDVLEYLAVNNKIVNEFWLTSFQNNDYLKNTYKNACITKIAEREIISLFKTIHTFKRTGKILEIIPVYDRIAEYQLTANIFLKLLSPSSDDIYRYLSNIPFPKNEEGPHNNPKANLISTVTQIFDEANNWQILLTADQEGGTFNKIYKKYKVQLEKKLLLGQASHHGAESNLNKFFWGGLDKIQNAPIVISVGENSYGHPSYETMEFYRKNNYELYATNEIWDYGKTTPKTNNSNKLTNLLDAFSEQKALVSNNPKLNGNQRFEIDINGTIKYIGN